MTIRSFSGAHPFRPACVITAAHDALGVGTGLGDRADHDEAVRVANKIVDALNATTCPRCSTPLARSDRGAYWDNAGSRVTRCRCIPICSDCGMHEGLARHFSATPLGVLDWPAGHNDVETELEHWRHGPARVRISSADHPLTDSGTVRQAQYAGGWRVYGYGDEDTPWPPDAASE